MGETQPSTQDAAGEALTDPALRRVVVRDLWDPVAAELRVETGLDLALLEDPPHEDVRREGPVGGVVHLRAKAMFQPDRRRVELRVQFASGPIHEVRLSGVLYLRDPPTCMPRGWVVRWGPPGERAP